MKNVCIIGVGGAAANMIKQYPFDCLSAFHDYAQNFKIKYGYISSSLEEIHSIQGLVEYPKKEDLYESVIDRIVKERIQYIAIGEKTCKGLHCSGDIENGKKAFAESNEKIQDFLKNLTLNSDLVITITGIGGGCGTAVTPLINEYIRSLKIPIVSIVQRPFKFEGKKRREDEFKSNIDIFKKSSNKVIVADAENVFNTIPNEKRISKIFYSCDIYIKEIIEKELIKTIE